MRCGLLVGLGVLCLVLAAWLRPAPEASRGGVWPAWGRSMGGARVMVIDALFLRAEAQRRSGRLEDAAALYQAVLDLDPENVAAAGFLANTYVNDLIPQVPDEAERFAWWQEARRLLERALRHHPGNAELEARLAGLILDPPRADPALGRRIRQALGDPERVALAHLARAVAGPATLPRLGRTHLLRVAALAPGVAARALAAGEAPALAAARATARLALERHGDVLEEVRLEDRVDAASLRTLLETGMRAVERVEALRAGRAPRSAAEAAIAAYETLVPRSPVGRALRDALPPP